MFGKKLFRQQKGTRVRQVTTVLAPRGIVINPILSSTINQMPVNAEWLSKLSVAAPLGMLTNPTGTHIYLQRQEPVLARLSGSSSPYSWQEVYSSSPGTLSTLTGGRSGTSNAYAYNGKSGLGGLVVELTARGGWWSFQEPFRKSPPNCVGKGNTLRFTLIGCVRTPSGTCAVPGASVDFVLGGVTVFSGTTDSLGRVDYFEPFPGTYTINWSVPGTSFSGSASAVIAANCTPSLVSASSTVTVPSGYQCCQSPQQNSRWLPFPTVASLFITDDAGTRAFGDCVVYNGYVLISTLTCSTTCSNELQVGTIYTPVPSPPTDPCTYLKSLPACGSSSSALSVAAVTLPATSESPFEIAGTWGDGTCGLYSGSFPLAGSSFLVHT